MTAFWCLQVNGGHSPGGPPEDAGAKRALESLSAPRGSQGKAVHPTGSLWPLRGEGFTAASLPRPDQGAAENRADCRTTPGRYARGQLRQS